MSRTTSSNVTGGFSPYCGKQNLDKCNDYFCSNNLSLYLLAVTNLPAKGRTRVAGESKKVIKADGTVIGLSFIGY